MPPSSRLTKGAKECGTTPAPRAADGQLTGSLRQYEPPQAMRLRPRSQAQAPPPASAEPEAQRAGLAVRPSISDRQARPRGRRWLGGSNAGFPCALLGFHPKFTQRGPKLTQRGSKLEIGRVRRQMRAPWDARDEQQRWIEPHARARKGSEPPPVGQLHYPSATGRRPPRPPESPSTPRTSVLFAHCCPATNRCNVG